MSFLKIKNLSFSYPKCQEQLIDKFGMEMEKGEIVALLGDSGCGKSTVLRLLCGLEEPKSGEIFLDDEQIFGQGRNVAAENRQIGMIFQDYALFPHLSVVGNVQFGISSASRREKRKKALKLLAAVHMEEHAHKPPHQCSGGQQQRIAIARAMAANPKLLLLDEPFSNLDARLRAKVRHEVKKIIKDNGISAILVTHDMEDVEAVADRYVCFN